MAEGWIKLHRKVLDCWIWQEKPYDKARAWVDLLLLAMHHDKKLLIENEVMVISRGAFMTSIVKLANRWGWSRNKVMRYLELLEKEQMLNTKRTPKGTLVTIVKYEDYQLISAGDETPIGTPIGTSNGTADGTTGETPHETAVGTQNKNIKNDKECIKNEREYNAPSFDAEKAWNDTFDKYPKKSAAVMAKQRWMEMLVDTPEPNRKDVAVLIFNAIKLYLLDYEKNNPDDKDFRYIPKLHTWFEQDCGYWITKAEVWQKEANGDA